MKTIKKIFAYLLIFTLLFSVSMPVEAAVKINQTKQTMYVGQTSTLKISGTSKKITWSSSNKKIATVSDSGKVTAQKAGRTNIFAKVNGKKYTCKVTVKAPYLNKTKLTLKEGKTYTLKLTSVYQNHCDEKEIPGRYVLDECQILYQ